MASRSFNELISEKTFALELSEEARHMFTCVASRLQLLPEILKLIMDYTTNPDYNRCFLVELRKSLIFDQSLCIHKIYLRAIDKWIAKMYELNRLTLAMLEVVCKMNELTLDDVVRGVKEVMGNNVTICTTKIKYGTYLISIRPRVASVFKVIDKFTGDTDVTDAINAKIRNMPRLGEESDLSHQLQSLYPIAIRQKVIDAIMVLYAATCCVFYDKSLKPFITRGQVISALSPPRDENICFVESEQVTHEEVHLLMQLLRDV